MRDEELPAAREPDVLVAEKVMGEKLCPLPDPGLECCRNCGMFGGRFHAPRPYSTDIAAAWEVVERVGGAFVEVTRYDDPVRYTVAFGDHPGDYTAEAETAPLAICRAALAWAEAKR